MKELRPAAQALKLKLEEIEAQPDAKGLESAVRIAKQKQVNAMMTTANQKMQSEQAREIYRQRAHAASDLEFFRPRPEFNV
jgi:hypothetical protein